MAPRFRDRAHVGELHDPVLLQEPGEVVERPGRVTDGVNRHRKPPKSSMATGTATARSSVWTGRSAAPSRAALMKRARTAVGSTSPRLPLPIRHCPSFTVADRYRRSRALVSAT